VKTWWNLNNPYAYRDENLKRLGFKSYQSYLRSSLWMSIRVRVFERTNGRCVKCRAAATQVHHRAYDPATLTGDSINALSAVCARCHKRSESRPQQRGDHLGQSNYQKLQRANVDILKPWSKKERKRQKRKDKRAARPTEQAIYEQEKPFWS
jgi:hypothetical protein